jgi:hypothetical protein
MSSYSLYIYMYIYTRHNPSHFMLTIGGPRVGGGKPLFCRGFSLLEKKKDMKEVSFPPLSLSASYPCVQTDKQTWSESDTMRPLLPFSLPAPGDVWIVRFILASAMIGASLCNLDANVSVASTATERRLGRQTQIKGRMEGAEK